MGSENGWQYPKRLAVPLAVLEHLDARSLRRHAPEDAYHQATRPALDHVAHRKPLQDAHVVAPLHPAHPRAFPTHRPCTAREPAPQLRPQPRTTRRRARSPQPSLIHPSPRRHTRLRRPRSHHASPPPAGSTHANATAGLSRYHRTSQVPRPRMPRALSTDPSTRRSTSVPSTGLSDCRCPIADDGVVSLMTCSPHNRRRFPQLISTAPPLGAAPCPGHQPPPPRNPR